MSPTGFNISPERQQLISSLMTLGAFLSSSSAGIFATKLGRRQCLWLASALCCVSNVVMMTTTSLAGLYAGRLLIGLANGWYMTFSQLYIQVSLSFHASKLHLLTASPGMLTSSLSWSPHLRLPNLDLHWHSRWHCHR
jgi:MFS family permease